MNVTSSAHVRLQKKKKKKTRNLMVVQGRRETEEDAEVVVLAVDRLRRVGARAMEAKLLENAAWLLYVERGLRSSPCSSCARRFCIV